MRILGVDPGLTRCGLGVVEARPDRSVRLVAVDVVRTPPDLAPELRLLAMAEAFEEWLGRHRPDAVAVERVFAQHNVRTVTGTAQVAGLAMVAATRAGIPVALHTPSEVKAAVTGSGRAEKAQVQEMVRRILQLEAALARGCRRCAGHRRHARLARCGGVGRADHGRADGRPAGVGRGRRGAGARERAARRRLAR